MSTHVAEYDFTRHQNGKYVVDHFLLDCSVSHLFPNTNLSPQQLDLLDIARAVYLADRAERRDRSNPTFDEVQTKPRTFKLTLPVRNPALIKSEALQKKLAQVLHFATQDNWQLEFKKRKLAEPARSLNQNSLFANWQDDPKTIFSLFSGGLDSVAGAMLMAAEKPDHQHIFITATGSHLQASQTSTFNEMNALIKRNHTSVRTGVTFNGVSFDTKVENWESFSKLVDRKVLGEDTQRSRGFLYLTLGAVIASTCGHWKLHVYENGIGAINLPYTRGSLGADHTRSMHPLFLHLMGEWFTLMLGRPFTIENPYWNQTKGQMCQKLKALGLDSIVTESISCERYRVRAGMNMVARHCGRCSSCLLRRVSTLSAEVNDTYYDRRSFERHQLAQDNTEYLWLTLMNLQVKAFETALAAPQPFPALIHAFPDLRMAFDGVRLTGLSPQRVVEDLLRLYQQYVKEWKVAFPLMFADSVKA